MFRSLGYHNFHHEFPQDYRNGIYWYDYDPTKWMIRLALLLGMVQWLNVTPMGEIEMARIVTTEDKISEEKRKYDWGIEDAKLPKMTMAEMESLVLNEDRKLIVINGYICDISEYMAQHPGGTKVLKYYLGKDASDAFNKGMNIHSRAAKTRIHLLKIARLVT